MARLKQSAFARFVKDNGDLFAFVKAGDLVKGTIIDRNPREVVIDLGKFGTGIVYRGELAHARELVHDLKPGDEIQAKVVEVDNDDGLIELSLAAAQRQQSWSEIEDLFGKEETFPVKPLSANKGGLLVDVKGIKAFLPASQLAPEHYPTVEDNDKMKIQDKLNELVGTELSVKIIDCNPRSDKLILSERAVQETNSQELIKDYAVGQVVDGIVSGIADFGVFIKFADNPDVEGLIHISELSYAPVSNPKDLVGVGDTLQAKIIDIRGGRISLSLKALQENPWEHVTERYHKGDAVTGTVYELTPFGALITLDKTYQGQVHITDFGGVNEMKQRLTKGEAYQFVIKDVKPDDERITLSLKS